MIDATKKTGKRPDAVKSKKPVKKKAKRPTTAKEVYKNMRDKSKTYTF